MNVAVESPGKASEERGAPGGRGELLVVIFGVWMIVGLFLDGWAHSEARPDSFFTPWHGVLYSGFAAVAAATLWQAHRNARSTRWLGVSAGEGLTFAGLGLFVVGAAGDLVWHQTLGIEVGLAALLSPTHLFLMGGGLLALSGPFRRAYVGADPEGLRSFLPAVVSLALATGVAQFFTLYTSPMGQTVVPSFRSVTTDIHDFSRMTPAAFEQLREMWALTGILFTTVLVLLPVVSLLRRWRRPPAGSLLVLFGAIAAFEAAGSELRRWPLALPTLAAGVVGEAMVRRSAGLVPLAAAVAATMWAGYAVVVAVVYGMNWSPELWAGSVVLATLLGAATAGADPAQSCAQAHFEHSRPSGNRPVSER